jgi:hypothetical protein
LRLITYVRSVQRINALRDQAGVPIARFYLKTSKMFLIKQLLNMPKPKFNNLIKWADFHAMGCEQFSPYHFRLDSRLDVWPTKNKYRFVDSSGEAKQYECFEDLLDILQW